MTKSRDTGSLNFKGDIRATIQPRVYDTAHGPMQAEAVSYDEETDRTTVHLVTTSLNLRPFVSSAELR